MTLVEAGKLRREFRSHGVSLDKFGFPLFCVDKFVASAETFSLVSCFSEFESDLAASSKFKAGTVGILSEELSTF